MKAFQIERTRMCVTKTDGLWMSLSEQVLCPSAIELWVTSPVLHKPGMVVMRIGCSRSSSAIYESEASMGYQTVILKQECERQGYCMGKKVSYMSIPTYL